MSTRIALSVVGAAVGGYFGGAAGAQAGWAIGGIVGGVVDPDKIYGPKLQDARAQSARDGVPIPIVYGTAAVSGTLIWAGPIAETENQDNGKGGPVSVTYSYTRSYAVMICEGPIVGIRRVWKDEKLVYDTTAGGEIEDKAASAYFARNVTFYLGDESQTADPTMEAIEGAGNVPAHRGTAYMVFEDDDVTNRAGSIPNYRFEVVAGGTADTVTLEEWRAPRIGGFLNQHWPLADPQSYYEFTGRRVLNGAGLTTYTGTSLQDVIDYFDEPGLKFDNYLGYRSASNTYIDEVETQDDVETPSANAFSLFLYYNCYAPEGFVDSAASGQCALFTEPTADNPWVGDRVGAIFHLEPYRDVFSSGTVQFFQNCTGRTPVGGYFPQMVGFNALIIEAKALQFCPVPEIAPIGTGGQTPVPGADGFEIDEEGNINFAHEWTYDAGAYRVLQLVYEQFSSFGSPIYEWTVGPVIQTGSANDNQTWWEAVYAEYEAAGSVPSGWVYGVDYPDNLTHACESIVQYDEIDSQKVVLSGIVSDLCLRSGLTAGDIDVTELTDLVRGFVVGRATTGSDAIQPLMPAFLFEAGEWDGKINFIKRGGTSKKTLTLDDLAERDGPRWIETRAQEAEYPRKVNVVYMSPESNYVPTKQTSEMRSSNINAVGEVGIELPIAFTGDEAAQVADILRKSLWTDLLGNFELDLSPEHSDLTPTDVVQFDNGAKVFTLRIESVEKPGGVVKIKAKQERSSAYQSSVTGTNPPEGETGVGGGPVGPTRFVVMNIPILRAQDDQLGIYVAACGVLSGWNGCEVMYSLNHGATWTSVGQIRTGATIGTTLTTLPNASPYVVDQTNTLQVEMFNGSLSSTTDSEFLRYANRAAVCYSNPSNTNNGQAEIIQFRDASVVSAGVYDLDYLMRNRLDSDQIGVSPGREFVYLGNGEELPNGIMFVPLPASALALFGRVMIKCVSIGTTEAESPETTIRLTGTAGVTIAKSQVEWEPQLVRGQVNLDESVSISWIGRGRIGTTISPSNSAHFNGYEVRIGPNEVGSGYSSGYYLSKVVTDSQATFSAAEITASSAGATQSEYRVSIYPRNSITGVSTQAGSTYVVDANGATLFPILTLSIS